MVDQTLRDLGAAHASSVGVLLEDGTEPGPAYFDVGSGSYVPSPTEWHAYDGRFGRPKAALLRGACACGWRGAAEYPLDWTALDDQTPLYDADVDLAGPIADYQAHLTVVRDATIPLPAPLTELLTALQESLATTAVKDPLVALKTLSLLGYLISEVGADAVLAVQVGRIPMETVATALGTSEAAARRYLNSYRHTRVTAGTAVRLLSSRAAHLPGNFISRVCRGPGRPNRARRPDRRPRMNGAADQARVRVARADMACSGEARGPERSGGSSTPGPPQPNPALLVSGLRSR